MTLEEKIKVCVERFEEEHGDAVFICGLHAGAQGWYGQVVPDGNESLSDYEYKDVLHGTTLQEVVDQIYNNFLLR